MGLRLGAMAIGTALALVWPGPSALRAAEPALELKWDQLVPPAPPKPPAPFFAGRPADGRIHWPQRARKSFMPEYVTAADCSACRTSR